MRTPLPPLQQQAGLLQRLFETRGRRRREEPRTSEEKKKKKRPPGSSQGPLQEKGGARGGGGQEIGWSGWVFLHGVSGADRTRDRSVRLISRLRKADCVGTEGAPRSCAGCCRKIQSLLRRDSTKKKKTQGTELDTWNFNKTLMQEAGLGPGHVHGRACFDV